MLSHAVKLICNIDPLKYLLSKTTLTRCLAKWVMLLSEFDIQVCRQKDHQRIGHHWSVIWNTLGWCLSSSHRVPRWVCMHNHRTTSLEALFWWFPYKERGRGGLFVCHSTRQFYSEIIQVSLPMYQQHHWIWRTNDWFNNSYSVEHLRYPGLWRLLASHLIGQWWISN